MSIIALTRDARYYRFVVVGLLVCAGCIAYLDRTAMAIANLEIGHDFGLSYSTLGLLLSSTTWFYMSAQLPAGVLSDRLPARWLLLASLLSWGASQILCGTANGVGGVLLGRCALGLGEAPLFLAGTRVIKQWFDETECAAPIGVFSASASFGQTIAPAILSSIMVRWGWHAMFLWIGVASAVMGVVWGMFYRDPGTQGVRSPSPRPTAAPAPPPAARGMTFYLRHLLANRTAWAMAVGFMGVMYLLWLYSAWLPTYLRTVQHFSAEDAGYLATIPQLSGFLGGLCGGFIVDALARRGLPPLLCSRQPLAWALSVASVATMAAGLTHMAWLTLSIMSIALFAVGVAMTCGWTLGAVIVGEDAVATMEAFQNVGGSFGAAMAPIVTGVAVQATGAYLSALVIAGAIGVGCVLVYILGVRRTIDLDGIA
ncbi:MFS transporter [Gluconacetobacter tumulisoli]|uniref:MFS transporter n=1 Tax=Gluconacetobacter tumulisoli TaxID=1286189 RepID=A0A7W4K913_9PROT|nr:MFS transporter [Gluconacetobacter tumulisoli]MBB2202548.1 MFS transporter [Gluconacetobacter tumulisoli]